MSGGSQRADSARETVRLALRRVESARDDLGAAGAMLKALLNSPQVGSLAPDVGPTQLEIFSRSLQVTAEYFRVPVYKLIGSRSYGAARPRQVAMWLCRQRELPFAEIGKMFERHHTTVLHACRAVEGRRGRDEAFLKETDALAGFILPAAAAGEARAGAA